MSYPAKFIIYILFLSMVSGFGAEKPLTEFDLATADKSLETMFSDSDLISFIANTDVFFETGPFLGFTHEAQTRAFSLLYERGSTESFEETFNRSKRFSGQLYALLGLWNLDRKKYEACSNKIKDGQCDYVFSTMIKESPSTKLQCLEYIENGSLYKELVYRSSDQRLARRQRFFKYLNYVMNYESGRVAPDKLVEIIADCQPKLFLQGGLGFSVGNDAVRLSFSELMDYGDCRFFCKLFDIAETVDVRFVALAGISVLDPVKYESYAKKYKQDDLDVGYRIDSDDLMIGEHKTAPEVLLELEKSDYIPEIIYVALSNRCDAANSWVEKSVKSRKIDK